MKAVHARLTFLFVSITLSVMLLSKAIDTTTSAILFAISLLVLGLASKGFVNK